MTEAPGSPETPGSPQEPQSEVSPEELRSWIRRHPETWGTAGVGEAISDEQIDRITRRALAKASDDAPRHRRRRRWIVGTGVGAAAVVAGTISAAAWLRTAPPTQPQAGIVCRAEAQVDADAIVIGADVDPVEGCRAAWDSYDVGGPGDRSELMACIGAAGAVEVFPGGASTCSELGLVLADPEITPLTAAIIALQDRLAEEINLQPCETVTAVASRAQTMLDESDLEGWTVVVDPGSQAGVCGKADVDPAAQAVVVVEF